MSSEVHEKVLGANRRLVGLGLAPGSFGNVSARDGDAFVIKPSGVDLSAVGPGSMVKVDTRTGHAASNLRPSTDTPTHRALYAAYPDIGGIAHTHSLYATAWAQALRSIPCLGTTHADYWRSDIPVTQPLPDHAIRDNYEAATGQAIIETLSRHGLRPLDCPAVLVAGHGPFIWGRDAQEAVSHAEILEYVAQMAWLSLSLNPRPTGPSAALVDHHFQRKHGPNAYYGQPVT